MYFSHSNERFNVDNLHSVTHILLVQEILFTHAVFTFAQIALKLTDLFSTHTSNRTFLTRGLCD